MQKREQRRKTLLVSNDHNSRLVSRTTHQAQEQMGLGFDIVKRERKGLKTKRKLALEMWSGKCSQLQGKGLAYRAESPRPEADSTEKRLLRARVRAFQNMEPTRTNFSFKGFKTKNTNSFLEQRAVSCGSNLELHNC